MLDSGGPRLGHHIGQDRPVDDVEQLLGDRLGGGQDSGAQPGDGEHGYADWLHLAPQTR